MDRENESPKFIAKQMLSWTSWLYCLILKNPSSQLHISCVETVLQSIFSYIIWLAKMMRTILYHKFHIRMRGILTSYRCVLTGINWVWRKTISDYFIYVVRFQRHFWLMWCQRHLRLMCSHSMPSRTQIPFTYVNKIIRPANELNDVIS